MNLQNTFVQPLADFVGQSLRVINVTHKPQSFEYRQIAMSTGIGILVIGIIGFVIAMTAHFLRVI